MKKTDIMERALILQGGVLDLLMQENVALKKKLAEPKWKTGHPEHGNDVLVCRQFVDWKDVVIREYAVDRYFPENNSWIGLSFELNDMEPRVEVLGWKEIEPFDLEEGE